MKVNKQYEKQIIKSVDKIPFEMKKIKFILSISAHLKKIKNRKMFSLHSFLLIYSVIITFLYFTTNI